MNDARDPRTDPRPGDVLEQGLIRATYEVEGVGGGFVRFRTVVEDYVPLDGWRRIAERARVVARGAGEEDA